jgi:MFS transporter, FHS family, glucose/mannose:H+ symporter
VVCARLPVTPEAAKPSIPAFWLTGTACAGMFGFGIVMALLGAILPLLAERSHFDLGQAGELFLAMNAAMLVTTLGIGPLLDRFGHKVPLIIAPLWAIAALSILSTAARFPAVVMAVIFLGIAGGALNQAANTLIADLYQDVHKKTAALNVLGVFFGFGALFIPFTVGSLLRTLGLAQILYIAMGLSLLPTFLSIPLAFPPPHQPEGVSPAEVRKLLRQPLLLAFSLLLFFESGNEFILGGYLTTYLTHNLGATVSTASYLLAVYWSALMVGRIILSRAALRRTGGELILAGAAAVVVTMSLFLASHSILLATVFVFLTGFSTAAIFPTALGLAGAGYAAYSGTVFSILVGTALVGGATLPWAVGKIGAAWNLGTALLLVVFDGLAILALGLWAQQLARNHG